MKLRAETTLPYEHDNVESPYYVKPELREFYLKVSPGRINNSIQNRAQTLMLELAREIAEDRFPATNQALDLARHTKSMVEEIKATRLAEFTQLAQHQLRLEEAEAMRNRARAAAAAAQLRLEQQRCPICGETEEKYLGSTKTRVLGTGVEAAYKEQQPVIRSCVPCWLVASDQYSARLGKTKHGKQSRLDLVNKYLDDMTA
jgi:hypothetical protein